MRVIYRKIRNAGYLYMKREVEIFWGARYELGARCLSKNTVQVRAKTVSLILSMDEYFANNILWDVIPCNFFYPEDGDRIFPSKMWIKFHQSTLDLSFVRNQNLAVTISTYKIYKTNFPPQ